MSSSGERSLPFSPTPLVRLILLQEVVHSEENTTKTAGQKVADGNYETKDVALPRFFFPRIEAEGVP